MDSMHHHHHFLSSSRHSNQKIHHIPKAKKKRKKQILATIVVKQGIGAADALKQNKKEIDAESKTNFDYVFPEDDLIVNKEIFDHENSKKCNISLKGNLEKNIAY